MSSSDVVDGSFSGGARAGVLFALASLLLGISFGVRARPVMGRRRS